MPVIDAVTNSSRNGIRFAQLVKLDVQQVRNARLGGFVFHFQSLQTEDVAILFYKNHIGKGSLPPSFREFRYLREAECNGLSVAVPAYGRRAGGPEREVGIDRVSRFPEDAATFS